MQVKVVLFDFDGTLIDSESVWLGAERQLLFARGQSLRAADEGALIGLDALSVVNWLRGRYGLTDSARDLHCELLELVAARQHHASVMPGAEALLGWLEVRRIPKVIVSNSEAAVVRIGLERLGWLARFEDVIGVDDVAHPKPHPAPYNMALQRLGLPAGACVALEDSVAGATSAFKAGLPVLGVQAQPALRPAALHDLCVTLLEDLTEARDWIEQQLLVTT